MEARFQWQRWRRIGVRPRGDQLRRAGGISEMPDSSKKTSQAPCLAAPFDPGPLVGHPLLDGLLVAFFGLALRALHAPTQPLAQQPPHRRVGQLHAGQARDDHADALQGPHVGGEPMRLGALEQRLLDRRQLLVADLGAPAGWPAGP